MIIFLIFNSKTLIKNQKGKLEEQICVALIIFINYYFKINFKMKRKYISPEDISCKLEKKHLYDVIKIDVKIFDVLLTLILVNLFTPPYN